MNIENLISLIEQGVIQADEQNFGWSLSSGKYDDKRHVHLFARRSRDFMFRPTCYLTLPCENDPFPATRQQLRRLYAACIGVRKRGPTSPDARKYSKAVDFLMDEHLASLEAQMRLEMVVGPQAAG